MLGTAGPAESLASDILRLFLAASWQDRLARVLEPNPLLCTLPVSDTCTRPLPLGFVKDCVAFSYLQANYVRMVALVPEEWPPEPVAL